jgi:group I intron endonuclease
MGKSYVYCWTNRVNGKRYIGKGQGRRAVAHMRLAFVDRPGCPKFYRAIRKHGPEAFELAYIATGLDDATAGRAEAALIVMYGTQAEYNVTLGGGMAGHRHTLEARARISAAKKGRAFSPEHVGSMRAVWAEKHGPRLAVAMAEFDGRRATEYAEARGIDHTTFRAALRAAGWERHGMGPGTTWAPPKAA